jgi:DNA polymerase-3 subunit alpha
VRLTLSRQGEGIAASAEVQLGEQAKFFPTDAALAGWIAQAEGGQAVIAYD